MTARVVLALPGHIRHLAAGMRQADREECWAWALHEPAAALEASLAASPLAWTGLLDEEPVCMFGAAASSLLAGRAEPWLLGTDTIERVPVLFGRMSRVALARILAVYPRLSNWTDARHGRSHAWLRWLGFALGEARPAGALGLPFRPFWMGTEA